MSHTVKILSLCLMMVIANISLAAKPPLILPIGEIDRQFMGKQVSNLDDLAGRYLGRQINGQKANDLEVMQLLLDRQLVKAKDTLQLQGMGVVIGQLLAEQEQLNWVAYTDEYGRSKALQIPGKDEVIFPVTMISRRAEVGIKVNVAEIYQLAESEVARIRRQIIIR